MSRSADVPAWWPTRFYYGWALVITLGISATASYGILLYGFAVFINPMSVELGWSKATITGAYSIAQLVAGLTAIAVGRWVDRHGARLLMTVGSVLATVLLVAWSQADSVLGFYVLWSLMGAAAAAILYEPAFAIVATWFRRNRGRALTVLTFIGGFASVIFVPLTTWLVERFGWRSALLWLALIHATCTIIPHAVVLRRRPTDLGLLPDGAGHPASPSVDAMARDGAVHADSGVATAVAIRTAAFRWLTIAFALSSLTATALSVHLVSLLQERGYTASFAGAAMGILGLMALPGRLVFTPLGGRWPRTAVTAGIFGLAALAIAALLFSQSRAAVWIFVALFGAGFGAITPARAALVADTFGAASYGEISGVLALVLSLARAAGPVGASFIYDATTASAAHRYDIVLVVLLLLTLCSVVAVLASRAVGPYPMIVQRNP